MEELKISYGEYKVYSSGSIIAYGNTPIKFFINDLIFSFEFEENPDEQGYRVNTNEGEDKKELIFRLVNFDNNLGTGSNKPLLIGNIGNVEIYLLLVVRRLGNSSVRELNYTWLLKAKNGE